MATQIEIQNNIHLERLLISFPGTEKKVKGIIRKIVRDAAEKVSQSASAVIANDPRKAANAVRSSVYKAVLGGNINIYSPRKAGSSSAYSPQRKLKSGQVGGNRIPRSQRTEQMMGYMGMDRGFVLRWLDSGTATRSSRYGNRGAITARPFFSSASRSAMGEASEKFVAMIEELLTEEMNAK